MISTIYFESINHCSIFENLHNYLEDPNNWNYFANFMTLPISGYEPVMKKYIVLVLSDVVVDLCMRNKFTESLLYFIGELKLIMDIGK